MFSAHNCVMCRIICMENIMNVVRILWKSALYGAVCALYILVTACNGSGGEGGDGASITDAEIQGSVGDGPIIGATLNIY
jgi:hypothetical protein